MTFASRRTGIFETITVRQILNDDGYEEISHKEQVKAGDVILYFADDGDCEHSGLVVKPPASDSLGVAIVRSKWAKYRELIHRANQCPYNFSKAKYFRVVK